MGVDWYPCDKCGETFPDCGHHDRCVKEHRLCEHCMPDIPHEWDVDAEDENRAEILSKRDDEGSLLCSVCPVCLSGGTEEEKLREENKRLKARIAELEAAHGRQGK